MKICLLIFIFLSFSLTFAQKSLIAKKFKKTNQDTAELNEICFIYSFILYIKKGDKVIGFEIGDQIIEKLNNLRKTVNLEKSLQHDTTLANEVYDIITGLIYNPDSFYLHNGFDSRANLDQDINYISESYAKIYKLDNPANEAYKEWIANTQVLESLQREFDEGESFCCQSGMVWYCAVLLAKYKTKYS